MMPVDEKIPTIQPGAVPEKIKLTANEKWKAIFQARLVLSKLGNMEERRICKSALKNMSKNLS